MVAAEWSVIAVVLLLSYLAWRLRRILSRGGAEEHACGRHPQAGAAAVSSAGVQCLYCHQALRIGLPPASNRVQCPRCGRRLTILLWDSQHHIYLSPVDDNEEDADACYRTLEGEPLAPCLRALGLNPLLKAQDLSLRELRKAYYKSMQRYHPDKYAQLPSEFRRVAERKSREIHAAYRKLAALKESRGETRLR